MSVTLASLIALVNGELENTPTRGSASATGDATSTAFLVAPNNRVVLDDTLFACFVDGVEDTAGAMDFTTGVYTFAVTQDGHALTWQFNYVYWTDAQVTIAIDAGVNALFPHFYNTLVSTIAITDSTEYSVGTANTHCIRQIETGLGDVPWTAMKRNKYEVQPGPSAQSVRFYTAPTGGLRVHTIERFALVAGETGPPLTEDRYEVPDRATAAIVSYSCYYLLSQKMAPRMRIDTAVTTTGGGNLSPRQMNDASNGFYLRFQMQVASTKMRPWAGL